MTLSEWQSRLQRKESLKADIELRLRCIDSVDSLGLFPANAMRRTYDKQLEIVSQEIDCCITAIVTAEKRGKIMKKGLSSNRQDGGVYDRCGKHGRKTGPVWEA